MIEDSHLTTPEIFSTAQSKLDSKYSIYNGENSIIEGKILLIDLRFKIKKATISFYYIGNDITRTDESSSNYSELYFTVEERVETDDILGGNGTLIYKNIFDF